MNGQNEINRSNANKNVLGVKATKLFQNIQIHDTCGFNCCTIIRV